MIVQRVEDERGSHIEPPLDQDWDNLTKLRWRAALVTVDCGLTVAVQRGSARVRTGDGPWRELEAYDIVLPNGAVYCGLGYHSTQDTLTGIDMGVRAALGYRERAG